MFRMGTEKVWCSQSLDEESKAENDSPLFSSRIINNYIEYLQEYHPDVEITLFHVHMQVPQIDPHESPIMHKVIHNTAYLRQQHTPAGERACLALYERAAELFRDALALAFAASLYAPLPDGRYGTFRM